LLTVGLKKLIVLPFINTKHKDKKDRT